MRIQVGNYVLNSDQYSYWISELRENGKSGKVREERVAGYCTDLRKLSEDFVERVLRSSDAEDLETVLNALSDAQASYKALLKEWLAEHER